MDIDELGRICSQQVAEIYQNCRKRVSRLCVSAFFV